MIGPFHFITFSTMMRYDWLLVEIIKMCSENVHEIISAMLYIGEKD